MAIPRDPTSPELRPLTELRPLGELSDERLAAIEVVATDVDGTLTAQGKLGPELLAALMRLTRAGILVIPISGRPSGEVQGLCRYLPGVRFGVAENGLLEIEPEHAPRWLSAPTDVARLHAVGEHLNRDHAAKLRLTGDTYCRVGDVAYERDGRDEAELLRLRGLTEAAGVFLIWSNVHIHLAEREPDKGAGLLALLERRGLDPSKVATIGDAPNDNGLFEPGRFGVTIGTADVISQRQWFRSLPQFVTAAREVHGFLELAERLGARDQS